MMFFSCVVLANAGFLGPDFPGKGMSGHYSQYSMDYARMPECRCDRNLLIYA